MDGLKDKVAIVTGGSTLIGAEVVRAFHAAGTKVVIADIPFIFFHIAQTGRYHVATRHPDLPE